MLTSAAPIKVMSFNIRYGTANDGPDRWEVRAPRAFAVIRQENPDLIGLQEALDFQVEELQANLKGYDAVGVGRDDGKRGGEFSAILLRKSRFKILSQGTFWLSDAPDQVASKTWGNGITRICTWAGLVDQETQKQFWLLNTHFDHQSQPSREKSAQLILQKIGLLVQGRPVILTGDFNAGETNPAMRELRKGGLTDTWRSLNPNSPEPPTFNGFRAVYSSEKIDAVLVNSFWRVREAEVVMTQYRGRWPSDHMPVTAVVEAKA